MPETLKMSSEIKTVVEKLMTELSVAQRSNNEQRHITDATVNDWLVSITSTTTIDDVYTCLHGFSVSPDCYCLFNEMLMSAVKPEWMFPEVWHFLSYQDSNKTTVQDILIEHKISLFNGLVNRLCQQAAVREFSEKKEALFTEKDFDGIAGRAVNCLKALNLLLKKLDYVFKACEPHSHVLLSCCKSLSKLMDIVSYKALFVCLEHMSNHPWTTESSISEAKCLLEVICSVNRCSTFKEYLCSPDHARFAKILSDLRPKLLSSTWKLNPSASHVFAFCVRSVRMPLLSDHLGSILSSPLLFVDDHEVHNMCLGLELIRHIVDNVSKAELRWYGRADVLYDLLSKQLYSREPEVLKLAIPCLFAVLDVVEKSPLAPSGIRQEVKHDKMFRVYIQNMSLETTVALRRVYSHHLSAFIAKLGITVVRHIEQVITAITCYLEVYDGPEELCRVEALEALQTLLCQAWPRMSNHRHVIVQSLVRLIYDVATERTLTPVEVNRRLLDGAVKCLKLLKQICPEKVEELLVILLNLKMNETVEDCITRVLQFQTDS